MAAESLNIVDYASSPTIDSVAEAVAATTETKHDATVSQSEHVETLSIATGMLVFSMILYMSFGTKLAHSSKYIGEGMSAAITGLAIGGILIILGNIILTQEVVEQLLTFDHSSFFTFYLPPIILFAGLSVRKKAFFRNLPTVAGMGIVGTYIAFAIIAGLLAAFSNVISGITLADCLALGTIFATTDSVAVLQVLEQDRAPLLFSLVFGEGVVNDATTVALLRTVQGLGEAPAMNFKNVCIIFGKFSYLFALSLVFGIACGFASSLLLKKFPATGTPQAVGLIGTTAYFAYLVGEHVGLSGIVVIFCCAVTMSHYAMHTLSKTQRAATMSAFETLSYFSEGSIFVYVGLDALDPLKWKHTHVGRALGLSVIVIFLLLFSRAVFSFPVLALHNYFKPEKLNWREMVIAWWAGGMRGAVSVALVYYYYDTEEEEQDPDHATLISMTLTVVLVSTLGFGAITKPLLDFMLGVDDGHGSESHGTEHSIEMTAQHGDGPDPLQPKAPHAVIDMRHGPEDGYETDATAFSDAGGYTTEEDGPGRPQGGHRRRQWGQMFAKPPAMHGADGNEEEGELLGVGNVPNQASLERIASLLKGTAPDALVPSPGGSPKAVATPPNWEIFGQEDQPKATAPAIRAAKLGNGLPGSVPVPLSAVPGGLPGGLPAGRHVHFTGLPQHAPNRDIDAVSIASGGSVASEPALMSRAASVPDLAARFRLPIKLGRPEVPGRPRVQSQQLAEWWASFDERYMKPMFSGTNEAWTPTSPEGRPHGHRGGAHEHSSSHHRPKSVSSASTPVSHPTAGRQPNPSPLAAVSLPGQQQQQQQQQHLTGAVASGWPHTEILPAPATGAAFPVSPQSRTASFPPRAQLELEAVPQSARHASLTPKESSSQQSNIFHNALFLDDEDDDDAPAKRASYPQ